MPVQALSPPCHHCQECGRRECCLVFRVQLDADLVHTLVSIYPEWFTGPRMEPPPGSPPHAQVDESPLHQAMDKNKESLKVKLMLRRPINQLVAQGIMPPLKTPPGFHEQRQKLERAKMGDLLKAKIQQRPDRQELVRQHILEDVGHVDPSLAERQRQLKKCRLADALNDQLSHRPGPLELIKKNILHTEEPIERAVKEGHIEFKATCEGQSTKPTPPDHYMLDEDSSSGGGGAGEVASSSSSSQQSGVSPSGIVTVVLTPTLTLPAALYSPPSTAPSTPRPPKPRKKSKAKAQPKTRTIKFHEYKGPPNAQKASAAATSTVETPYELLLQQQQLFLQWQLEWQHKYPQILLPASQKPVVQSSPQGQQSGGVTVEPPTPPPLPQSPPPPPPLRNLEDMKVSDLKAELKRRNLPVSGAKPQLIERLKPFSETAPTPPETVCNGGSSGVSSPGSPSSVAPATPMETELSCDHQRIDHLHSLLISPHMPIHATFQEGETEEGGSEEMPLRSGGDAMTNAKASLAAFLHQHHTKPRSGSLPNFVGTFVNGTSDDLNSFIDASIMKPQIKTEAEDVKSQIVDDVLEILIKNGELPASAADGSLLDPGDDSELMEVDADWLEGLMHPPPSSLGSGGGGDPVLAPCPPPDEFMDLLMDDTDHLKPHIHHDYPWDRIDFAA